jgi:hypothetical protein
MHFSKLSIVAFLAANVFAVPTSILPGDIAGKFVPALIQIGRKLNSS